ncbi:MAG TPA: hypothetical protein VM487_18485 [Phycisphaerae bacterium]|nr:hypothetical protein [Phycisphaerae bacterium]
MRLDVLKPGSSVKIGPKQDISAMILQVRIQEQNYVDYQVVWWSGRERKTEWIGNLEVAGGSWGDELSIGFNN